MGEPHELTPLALPKVTGRSSRQRKREREKEAEAFRDAVWDRDQSMDRATGKPLIRDFQNGSIHEAGQVCHLKSRRVMPEWKTDPRRGLLLSAFNHMLSDHRGGNLLKITDPETGEPATDASKPVRFTLYTKQGQVRWTRISAPPAPKVSGGE